MIHTNAESQGRYYCMDCPAPAFPTAEALADHQQADHRARPLPVFPSPTIPGKERIPCSRCGMLMTRSGMTIHQRGRFCLPPAPQVAILVLEGAL